MSNFAVLLRGSGRRERDRQVTSQGINPNFSPAKGKPQLSIPAPRGWCISMSLFHSSKEKVADYFHFAKRNTTYANEIRGGCVTFLTMSYILLVNPQIVSDWLGGDGSPIFASERAQLEDSVATGTALVCSVGSMAMGLVANAPFAVGPGMSMNSVFAGMVPLAVNQTQLAHSTREWSVAVTSAFFGGALVFAAGLLGLGPKIVLWLPDVLKSAIRVGIGLFQCFLALRVLRIVQSDATELLKFTDHFDFSNRGEDGPVAQILFVFTLFLTSTLYILGARAPILISILVTTIVCWIARVGGVSVPTVPLEVPTLDRTLWNFDWQAYFSHLDAVGTSGSYLLITLFDVGGAMFAIFAVIHEANELAQRDQGVTPRGSRAHHSNVREAASDHGGDEEEEDDGRMEESDGLVRRKRAGVESTSLDDGARVSTVSPQDAQRIYTVVGLSTMFSSVVGCSPTVVFLESLAGVASGARTGFSSIVAGALFLLSLPFGPVFRSIPACAAVPALVLVGSFMLTSVGEIPWQDHKRAFPAFVTIILMPFTASITPGIVGGVVTYVLMEGVVLGGRVLRRSMECHTHTYSERETRRGGAPPPPPGLSRHTHPSQEVLVA